MFERPIKPEPWHTTRLPSSVDARRGPGFRHVYPEGDTLGGGINLRDEIQHILQTRGHYIYLRRAKYRRCGCWNAANREANIDCRYCTGTGWLYKDELRLARKMPLTDPVIASLLERRTPIGLFGVPQFMFWFDHTLVPGPSRRDVILEVTLDQDTGLPKKPVNIEAIWNIGQRQDYRDKGGRIEYWAVWVKSGELGKE